MFLPPVEVEPPESIHKWMHEGGAVNEKSEPLTFQDHMFLYDPYMDFCRRQVYKKCSQVGVSVMMVNKCSYAMKNYRWNIIYTLPSDKDVEEFVPTKVDKIVQTNTFLRTNLQSDKVALKQMWDRFLYFKGTRSKSAEVMTTADVLVHDEKDRSDLGVIQGMRSRTKKSEYKGIWELSNPSVKNAGVDVTWTRSDQKEWMVTCGSCHHEQTIDWYHNVDYLNKVYVCRNCGEWISDIERRLGRWVAMDPESDISGYHISQMMAPWISARELISEEEETDEEYFHNFILGEPIGSGEAEDFRSLIIDAWTPKEIREGPYFMGVDIGSTKHYVIGNMEGIFKVGKLRTRQELEMLIEHYNPTVVMDAGPERTWAEEFRRAYPKLWINFYKRDRDSRNPVKWGEKEENGIVRSDRHRVIDKTVSDITFANISFDLPPRDLESYIKHWEVMVKKKEIDSMGLPRFSWDKNSDHAQDHWVHATVYYNIARSRGKAADFISSKEHEERPQLVVPTVEGHQMNDLETIMAMEQELVG